MKINFHYLYFSFLTCLSIVCGIYAVKCGPYREMDFNMDIIERDKEYYDEEMAVRLATASKGWEEDAKFQEVIYYYPTNEWFVILKQYEVWMDIIGIRSDNGQIHYY